MLLNSVFHFPFFLVLAPLLFMTPALYLPLIPWYKCKMGGFPSINVSKFLIQTRMCIITFLTSIWLPAMETIQGRLVWTWIRQIWETLCETRSANRHPMCIPNLYQNGLKRSNFHRYHRALNLQIPPPYIQFIRATFNLWTLFLGHQKWYVLSLPAL